MDIEVLRTGIWTTGRNNQSMDSLGLQITLCQYDNIVFCVRENINGIPSFNISAGERWGDKTSKRPRPARQSLELLAPADVWEKIADLVKANDPHKRPVLRNTRFTWGWVSHHLNKES